MPEVVAGIDCQILCQALTQADVWTNPHAKKKFEKFEIIHTDGYNYCFFFETTQNQDIDSYKFVVALQSLYPRIKLQLIKYTNL